MKNNSTSIKYGIITGIFLVGYFFLLGELGYIHSPAYSIFNALICALGIFMAITERNSREEDFTYKMGFDTGIKTGVIATIIFTLFFIFFAVKQQDFVSEMTQKMSFMNMNYTLLVIIVAILGFISVYVVTLILMKYFKKNWDLN